MSKLEFVTLGREDSEERYLKLRMEVAEAKGREKVKHFSNADLDDKLNQLSRKLYLLDGTPIVIFTVHDEEED